MKKITIENNEIIIQFQAKGKEEFHNLLTAIKTIPGRRFVNTEKAWRCPKSQFAFNVLKLYGFPINTDENKSTEERICKKETIIPIAPKGLKKEPWEFQKTGIGFVESRNGRAIIADEMRCISGDAEIVVNRGGGTRKIKFQNLYKKFNGYKIRNKGWNLNIPTYTRSMTNQNEFRLNQIEQVFYSGEKPVYEIKTEKHNIKATKTHLFFTEQGETPLSSLKIGDSIYVNGQQVCSMCKQNTKVVSYKYAKFKGFCPHCVYKYKRNNFNRYPKSTGVSFRDGYKIITRNLTHHPYNTSTGIFKHRLIYEAHLNNISYKTWKKIIKFNRFKNRHIFISPKYSVHHKNGIRTDNRIKNLELLTIEQHARKHGLYSNFKKYFIPKLEKIISIKYFGKNDVYDIKMKSPHHNFIANGIVVHNCGKTVQALGWLQLRPNEKPTIIICDASAKLVWAQMIKDWLPESNNKVQIIESRKNNNIIKDTRFIIVNYESLYQTHICDICEGRKIVFGRRCLKCKGKGKIAQLREDISGFSFFTMIVDEAQKMRNINTYYTKIILELGKKIKHVIATTGTPIENRPEEFYNIISLIDPSLFPTRWDFRKRYCGLYHDGFGWKYNGATNTSELHKILTDTIMIRRLRKEVEKDTPEKVRPLVPIEFDENCRQEYKITSKTLAEMESGSPNILAEYEHLKQIAVQGKMKGVIKWIEEFLEEGNQKLIVFAVHKKVINILHNHFRNISVVLDGSTSSKINKDGSNERKNVEIEFQTNPKIRLFIGNIQAAGKAICLDAANDVAFIEFSFVPGHHLQAEDRPIHMRKKGGCIYAWYLIAKDTIEEDIFKVLDKKCKVLGQILDGKDTEEESIFGELLGKLKEREEQ